MSFQYTPPTDPTAASATRINVTTAAQLAGTLSSDVVYYIDGKIDMGSDSITVPEGGLTMTGAGYDISSIYSTSANATLFVSPGGSYSGNLNLAYLTLYATGTSAQVFNLDNAGNFSAIELLVVNLGTFGAPGTETTSLGTLANYRQMFMNGCAIIRIEDGLELVGAWAGGLTVTDSIMLVIPAGVSVFKAGTGFAVAGSVRTNMNALSITDTTTVFDFAPANITEDQGFILDGARFPVTSDPLPNLPVTSTKRFSRNCSGIENSFPGGVWSLTTEAATACTVNVPIKLAGVTTYSNTQWILGLLDNAFIMESAAPLRFRVQGNLELNGTKNDVLDVTVRVWDTSAGSYVDVQTFRRSVTDVSGKSSDAGFFNFECYTPLLSEDDRIELWVTNVTGSRDVTVLEGGTCSVTALV